MQAHGKAAETLLEEKRQAWFVSSREKVTVDIRKKPFMRIKPLPAGIFFRWHLLFHRWAISPMEAIHLITSMGMADVVEISWLTNQVTYSQTGLYIYIRDIEQKRFWAPPLWQGRSG